MNMFSKEDLNNPELIKEITDAALGNTSEVFVPEVKNKNIKKNIRRSSGVKKYVDEETEKRKANIIAYDKARNIKWEFNQEDFTIDENFNFTHSTWKGVYCKGGDNVVATVEIINMYITECQKPYGQRDLSFLHLVTD